MSGATTTTPATPDTTTIHVCPGAPKKPNQRANSLPGVLIRTDQTDQTPPSSPRTLECPGAPRASKRVISTWGNVLEQQGQ